MFKKYKGLCFLIIPIISSIIIFSWFSEGKIISNRSEENLNIVHAQDAAERFSTFWNPAGTGWKLAFMMPSYPTFLTLGFLQAKGMPVFLMQAIFLWTIMTTGMFSVYILLRQGLKFGYLVSTVGSLFYLLNLFSITQTWKRFLYDQMFAWTYAPLFTFLWIKLMDGKKIIWFPIFLLSSLIFTYAFVNPVYLITFWSIAAIFVFTKMWVSRHNRKALFKIFLRSFAGFIFWVIINAWWFYPTLSLGSSWTSMTGQTWQSDFDSLKGVSNYFPIWDVLTLRQSWYLGSSNGWTFFQNPLSYLPSILILMLSIYGMIKLKHQYKRFLIALAAVGLFISKGTSFPLGFTFFHFLFSSFPLTAALRNSYEKFGLVWLLPYTIFFGYGFYRFFLIFKGSTRYFYGGIIIIISLGLLVYPIWNGDIFPSNHKITVPGYYIEANDYLKSTVNWDLPNRAFHFPFLLNEDIVRYSWGYFGEDPSENLFHFAPVSKPGRGPRNSIVQIMNKDLQNKGAVKVLGLLGVQDVILHKDSLYPEINLEEMIKIIENWPGIIEKKEFGLLTVYPLDKSLVNPWVLTISSFSLVDSLEDGISKIMNGEINYKNTVFVMKEGPLPVPETILQKNINLGNPIITFKKLSNSSYRVDIKDAKTAFILVLNNSFDRSWQARVDKEIIRSHFLVNGFANGWLIDKVGSYNIDINLKVWPWD